jgi:hypothetical protein
MRLTCELDVDEKKKEMTKELGQGVFNCLLLALFL